MKSIKNYMSMLVGVGVFYVMSTAAFSAPAPIITSTQDRTDTQNNNTGIGLTSSIAQRPFVGVKDQSASLLYISYRYKRFYIEGLDVGYNLYKNKKFSFDLLGTPRFYEVEPAFASNGELDGIDITKPSYFGGFSAQRNTDYATFTLQILHDLVESEGNELVVQIAKSFKPNNDFTLTPSAGAVYQDDKLVDYYYGVQSHEVRTGRAQYTGNGSINYNATLNAKWIMTKHIEILGQVKYEVLGKGIKDSPIVDEDSIYTLTLGAIYRF